MQDSIYDGCGVVSSEVLKHSFDGFKEGILYKIKDGEEIFVGNITSTDIDGYRNVE